jgi:hypothetical protein
MTTTVPNMTHIFSLTRWDLLRGQMYTSTRNPVLIGLYIAMGTFIACTSLREPDMAARPLAFKVFFVLAFDVLFFLFISVVTLAILWLTMLMRKQRGVLGEHTLEITIAGLVERTEFNETVHRWPGFHKIVRTRNYLFL